jgi:uncharacterized membrane protein (DUF485 family)
MPLPARTRLAFRLAVLIGVLYVLIPVLTAFTPVLDGRVAGVGVAYLYGFAQIVVVLIVAIFYRRKANALDGVERQKGSAR